jgi:hypothetical protein
MAAGLMNVWADIGAVDSATKSIVAAGDSLARQSATAEAAARRAAIDSAARVLADSLRRDTTTRVDSVPRVVPPVMPLDSAGRARARVQRDSIAAARARRARRDSIARANDTTRRDTSRGVRP